MPTGMGLAKMGTSLYGYGSPDTTTGPSTPIYIDGANGAQQDARKIDPFTGRYILTTQGNAQGMSGIQQRVLIAIKTARNSAGVQDLGNPSGTIQKVGRDVQKQISDAYRLALKTMTDAKDIEIVGIDFAPPFSPTGQFLTLRWRDLTTTTEHSTTI